MKWRGQKKDYGYKINVNEEPFKELYERYKKWKGIPRWCPLSDEERKEFENYIGASQMEIGSITDGD